MTTATKTKKPAVQLRQEIMDCRRNLKKSRADEKQYREDADSESRYQERLTENEADLLQELEQEYGEEI